MAAESKQITERFFGKTISLLHRYTLQMSAITAVYTVVSTETILLNVAYSTRLRWKSKVLQSVTWESDILLFLQVKTEATPPEYIAKCARILKKYVDSITIEVYSLTEEEYEMLYEAGVDGFTMFQETYNEELYPSLHPIGEKGNFRKRLNSPELACKAHYHSVNIGALLGLDDWRKDTFFTGLHAWYLQNKYSGTDIAVSLPRLCEHEGVSPAFAKMYG